MFIDTLYAPPPSALHEAARRMCLRLISAVVLAAAQTTGAAHAAGEAGPTGRQLFNRTCGNAHCHGTDGTGGGAPALTGLSLPPEVIATVLSKGIPGTRMRSFADELSVEEVTLLIGFVTERPVRADALKDTAWHDTEARPRLAKAEKAEKAVARAADTERIAAIDRGKRLFFDLSRENRCTACHSVGDRGGTAAVDLTDTAAWPETKLEHSVKETAPSRNGPSRAVAVVMRDGERYVGLVEAEDAKMIRIADVSCLPVVHRTFAKAELGSVMRLAATEVPAHAAMGLSAREVRDAVAFMRARGGVVDARASARDR